MTDNREVVIVSAARTPIGRFQGGLSGVSAPELGAVAVRAAVDRAGIDPAAVDEVLMGHVLLAGAGQAPARQAAINGGLPATVSATTINKVCGSGLKAVMMASQAIKAGDGDIFVTGGMENMNLAPHMLPNARAGYRLGNVEALDAMIKDGLWCPFEDQHMGNAAEWVARKYELTRRELDEFSVESHRRAVAAQAAGAFDAEIVPVVIQKSRGPVTVGVDEGPRPDSSVERLAKLAPVFQADGVVTAGNASPISDGAAALVVMSGHAAQAHGVRPIARITGYAQAGVEPIAIFTAPIFAMRKLMDKMGVDADYFDLFEINEAFASQMLADAQDLRLDLAKVNVNGGAIALGHPLGASGARVLVTLIHALQARNLQRGVASLCLGGGEAVALAVEMI